MTRYISCIIIGSRRCRRHQQHVLLPALLIAVCLAAATAARIRDWDQDNGDNWNTDNNWNGGGSQWNGGGSTWNGGQSFRSRDPSTSGAGDPPGPPTGPTLVRDNGGSSVKSKHGGKTKGSGPQQGFTGGSLPKTRRCDNPALPGCQSCVGDICTACYEDLGDATFVLSTETNQCMCPAGYGRIAEGDLPDWWDRTQVPVRRLLQLQELSSNTSTAAYSPDLQHVQYSNITQWQQEDEQQQEVTTLGLPMPPPAWATDCLPCPINFFSPGGAIGFAECKVCPAGWTTGNASASADCMVPYCPPGQEVNRRTGRCRPCAFGTYRPADANNQTCVVCPSGYTTPAVGSTSRVDCRVPVCQPGQQLDIDLFVCKACTGNTISLGGKPANGPYQPFCVECPAFMAAVNHTVCLDEACPPPEAFSIKCRQDDVPACGPGGKTLKLDNYCTAYPVGSVLQWARAEILATKDPVTNTTTADYKNAVPTTFASPAIATCPAGATGTNVWYPFITAYKNSRNCFCTSETSCKFEPVNQVAADSAFKVSNFNSTFNITIHDPQLTSLRRLIFSIGTFANYTEFGTRLGSYCLPSAEWSNGLETSCLGPYLYRISYAPTNITDGPGIPQGFTVLKGTLPPASQLPGLSHLQEFTCAGCWLRGTFPPDWGTSSNLLALRQLDLGTNQFTGTLPDSWGGLVNLVNLTLSSWSYVGAVPPFWGQMRSLALVNLTNLGVDPASCFPAAWETRNGLVQGSTFMTNAGQPFCQGPASPP